MGRGSYFHFVCPSVCPTSSESAQLPGYTATWLLYMAVGYKFFLCGKWPSRVSRSRLLACKIHFGFSFTIDFRLMHVHGDNRLLYLVCSCFYRSFLTQLGSSFSLCNIISSDLSLAVESSSIAAWHMILQLFACCSTYNLRYNNHLLRQQITCTL